MFKLTETNGVVYFQMFVHVSYVFTFFILLSFWVVPFGAALLEPWENLGGQIALSPIPRANRRASGAKLQEIGLILELGLRGRI